MLKYSTYVSIYDKSNEANARTTAHTAGGSSKTADFAAIWNQAFSGLFSQDKLFKFALVIVLIISGFTVVGNVFAGSVALLKQEKRIVVERGDTLWSIALENKPAGMKTAVYIEGIRMHNDIQGSEIQAGEVISLPVY